MKLIYRLLLILACSLIFNSCKEYYFEEKMEITVASELGGLNYNGENLFYVHHKYCTTRYWVPLDLHHYEGFEQFISEYETGYEYTLLVIYRHVNMDLYVADGDYPYKPTYKFKKILKKERKNSEGLPEPISGEE